MQRNLKELRRRCNLTQIELAAQSGVSRSRIQLAEAGTLALRPEELGAIRKALRSGLERTAELVACDPKLQGSASEFYRSIERLEEADENESSSGVPES